jgi:hypothetical protein
MISKICIAVTRYYVVTLSNELRSERGSSNLVVEIEIEAWEYGTCVQIKIKLIWNHTIYLVINQIFLINGPVPP